MAASGKNVFAVADDLTGAAEIAAIGHRTGWRSQVVTRPADAAEAELTAFDTDTRLLPAADAARLVTVAGESLTRRARGLVYKKTDSVLRGPVLAELTALAAALGKKKILFVPCNPALGRTIRDGRYFINGTPLDQTVFARDPHHPARTSVVAELLGGDPQVLSPGSALPASGVIVGEAATSADVQTWAARVTDDVLPAGGGEFFAAVLRHVAGRDQPPLPPFEPARPTLLVCGSLVAPRRAADLLELPLAAEVIVALAQRPLVTIGTPSTRSTDPAAPARIRRTLAALVKAAAEKRAFHHLMIEGGATAAEILATLGWTRLTVAREWAQGVVTLRPTADESIAVTMKPGSYAWPDSIFDHGARG